MLFIYFKISTIVMFYRKVVYFLLKFLQLFQVCFTSYHNKNFDYKGNLLIAVDHWPSYVV